MLLFKNSIKTKRTYETYLYNIEKFREYYKLRDIPSIITVEPKKLEIMIEDYIMEMKNRDLSRSAVSAPLYSLEALLVINDVLLNWKKIRKLLPAQGKKGGKHAWTTKQIQKMLDYVGNKPRSTALIHVLASTGARIGAIAELKIKDLREMPGGCKAVCIYADDIEEYYTFLTPEASESLDVYFQQRRNDGELLKPDSPVFRQDYKIGIEPVKSLKWDGLSRIMYRIVAHVELDVIKNKKRYEVSINHGFRKRFNTILKTTPGMNSNLAEKMMGHSTSIPLDDVYLDASIEKLFVEFKKAVPELTIDDSVRKQVQLEQKEKENTELQKKVSEIEELKRQREQDKIESQKMMRKMFEQWTKEVFTKNHD